MAGALISITSNAGSILLSKGRADIAFKWDLITLILLTIGIMGMTAYGIVGVAVAVTVVVVFMASIIQLIANRLIGLDALSYLRAIYPAMISSAIMMIFVFIFKSMSYSHYNMPETFVLMGSMLVGFIFYLIVLKLVWKDVINDIKVLYHNMLDKNT